MGVEAWEEAVMVAVLVAGARAEAVRARVQMAKAEEVVRARVTLGAVVGEAKAPLVRAATAVETRSVEPHALVETGAMVPPMAKTASAPRPHPQRLRLRGEHAHTHVSGLQSRGEVSQGCKAARALLRQSRRPLEWPSMVQCRSTCQGCARLQA